MLANFCAPQWTFGLAARLKLSKERNFRVLSSSGYSMSYTFMQVRTDTTGEKNRRDDTVLTKRKCPLCGHK